jgi:hypothetical protein
MHTDLFVRLNVVASGFSTIVLRSELLFPELQIISEHITLLFDLGDTHGGLCGSIGRKWLWWGERPD